METTQEFKDWYKDLNREPNVQVQFKELFLRTRATIAKERQLSLEVVLLIARLDRDNGAVNLGFSSQMEKLDRAKEVLSARGQVPSQEEVLLKAVEDLLEKRDPVRKAARAERRQKKTPSAQKEIVQKTSSSIKTTRRAASLKKAPKIGGEDSAHKGSNPSAQKDVRRAIPAAIKHELVRRSGGRCMYQAPDGSRCSATSMLEVDHILAHSRGGTDDISNLRILCREHNMAAAAALFGQQHMAPYKMKRHSG